MKKSYLLFLSAFLLAVLAACGPSEGLETTTPERTEPEVEGEEIIPRPTITPVTGDEGAETLPEATEASEEYPPPSAPIVQPEAVYPGEEEATWIVLPVGIQCEGDGPYSDLDEAVLALDEAGVIVVDQTTIELAVPQACGQPTSEHFRVQILAAGLPQAENLGWQLESE
jgi:hypothetical protein